MSAKGGNGIPAFRCAKTSGRTSVQKRSQMAKEKDEKKDEEQEEEKAEEAKVEETPEAPEVPEAPEEQVEAAEEKVEEKVEEIPEVPAAPEVPEPPKPPKEEKKPEPTGKFKALIKDIEELSVLDLAELVKALEERFGVTAGAQMMMAPLSGAPGAGAAPAEEEKATATVFLASSGDRKIDVIKAVREITGLGLKEAKDLVDAAPKNVKENVARAEAEEMKAKLVTAGATVELK